MPAHTIIDIEMDGITINGTKLTKPFTLQSLKQIFGTPTVHDNPNPHMTTHVWDREGIRTFTAADPEIVTRLDILFAHRENSKFSFMDPFRGDVTIDHAPLATALEIDATTTGFIEKTHGDIKLEASVDQSLSPPFAMLLINSSPAELPVKQPATPILPIKADHPIPFADFNFKLAVINELMFRDEPVLEPFSLDAFVAGYTERTIDINNEGFEPIPEVVRFFEEYAVDEQYTPLVSSLYLDGGNSLYGEIAPLWGGDTPVFDIADFSDLQYFPQLKQITNELTKITPEQAAQIKAAGVSLE